MSSPPILNTKIANSCGTPPLNLVNIPPMPDRYSVVSVIPVRVYLRQSRNGGTAI